MVHIQPIGNDTFEVNGKIVYKDLNSNWISRPELSFVERKAFKNYIKADEVNNIIVDDLDDDKPNENLKDWQLVNLKVKKSLCGENAIAFLDWVMTNCELANDNSLWTYNGEDWSNEGLYVIFLETKKNN